jgi:hypothetical protein
MVSENVVQRSQRWSDIQYRYEKQEVRRIGGKIENIRRDWTPAQKRRMKKKLRKALDLRDISWMM